ncbi:MAG TPA: DNA-formamidopyrimidine glycosylase family protein [Mycobacteriales bacterium]|nr:DNA-formamidopyrimidine glycosylase family protein [Mycobacteriales bacterium]
MPELPEVEALAAFLRERAVGHTVARLDTPAISALKTFDPPPTALPGLEITGAGRYGKFLALQVDGLHLVVHLARAGWLHWRDSLPPAPPKPGRGPIAARLHLDDGSGFDLTEQGTQKKLAVYLVRAVTDVPGIARLGPDALDPALTTERLGELLSQHGGQLKGALTDQTMIAGVGNAYSDEILHVAKLSPFKPAAKLSEAELSRLHAALVTTLRDAVDRSIGQKAATLKAEKRSGLRVHARTGLPCPVCGDTVREVSFASKSMQYCPTCQTNGQLLADRRLSKLLK